MLLTEKTFSFDLYPHPQSLHVYCGRVRCLHLSSVAWLPSSTYPWYQLHVEHAIIAVWSPYCLILYYVDTECINNVLCVKNCKPLCIQKNSHYISFVLRYAILCKKKFKRRVEWFVNFGDGRACKVCQVVSKWDGLPHIRKIS